MVSVIDNLVRREGGILKRRRRNRIIAWAGVRRPPSVSILLQCLTSRGCVFEVAGDFRISMERDAAAGVPEEQVPHVCGKVIFAN